MGLKDLFKKSAKTKQPVDKEKKEDKMTAKPVVSHPAKKESEGPSVKLKVDKENTGNAYKILVKPLITEKVTQLGSLNQYAFAVSKRANKIEIRKAVRKVYGVNPVKINIVNLPGKSVKWGRTTGKTNDWKKAIIFLKPNDKIEVVEGT